MNSKVTTINLNGVKKQNKRSKSVGVNKSDKKKSGKNKKKKDKKSKILLSEDEYNEINQIEPLDVDQTEFQMNMTTDVIHELSENDTDFN